MPEEEILRSIEDRLSRLENSIASTSVSGGMRYPVNPVVDPPPWGGGGWWNVPRWHIPFPVDPPPWGGGGWNVPRWPVPSPVDPPPWGGGFRSTLPSGPQVGVINPPIGTIGDPPPFDLSRLNIAQLESSLHNINAERARLESLEKLVKDQIAQLKEQG